MPPKRKPVVFISHITEEKEIAVAFQQLVEKSFLQAVELFVASDDKSIPMGKEWLNTIKDRLTNCVFEIVIASPDSIGRVWIGFEAGAVWIRDKPVIALCHSGISKDKLPAPLGHLQSADATNESHLQRIFGDLATELGMACPSVDFAEFITCVTQFEELSKLGINLTEHSLIAPTGELSGIEVATLKAIAGFPQSLFSGIEIYRITSAMNEAGFHSAGATTALSILSRKEFVRFDQSQDSDGEWSTYVHMQRKGWDWLGSNHDLIDFTQPPMRY